MKQTAVEWLEKELQKAEYIEKIGCVTHIIQQAKEMEKQQIKDANNVGYSAGRRDISESAEEYYNRTFKKQ